MARVETRQKHNMWTDSTGHLEATQIPTLGLYNTQCFHAFVVMIYCLILKNVCPSGLGYEILYFGCLKPHFSYAKMERGFCAISGGSRVV